MESPGQTAGDINRALRSKGLLHVYTQAGMEYLDRDLGARSPVADHQIAHVYVTNPLTCPRAQDCAGAAGVAEVLDEPGKAAHGLDHPALGTLSSSPSRRVVHLLLLAGHARAPDFAGWWRYTQARVHPAELFLRPGRTPVPPSAAPRSRWRARSWHAYLMSVSAWNAGCPPRYAASHGRLADNPADGPVLLCSDRAPPARG